MFTPEVYNEISSRLFEPLKKYFEAAAKTSKAASDTEPPLTVKEASHWLKRCEKTVLVKIANGQLRAANVGTLERPVYLIMKSDLIQYFNAFANRR